MLRQLEQLALDALKPALTLVLDLPPEAGLARAHSRGDANRFEAESLAFMRRVREGFLQRAAADPQRCVIIDAAGDEESVWTQIRAVLEKRW